MGETETDSVLADNHESLYFSLKQRQLSFKNWGLNSPDKFSLAHAGFYHTNVNDKVICFSCQGGLHKWEATDNPYLEHAFWFPQCSYIRKLIGDVIMDEIERVKNENSLITARHKLYSEETALASGPICQICLRKKVNIVLFPCRHAKYCSECIFLTEKKYCPTCSSKISMYLSIKA